MKNFRKYHFSGQKQGEEIILVVRRHWFNILEQMILVFFMVLFLIGSYVVLPIFFPVFAGADFHGLLLFLANTFALFIWVIFLLIWVDYYLDVWIITNARIVNIEQKGLFKRVVSELELSRVQDITTEVTGIIPTFLNYGDVYIQTAAETERFQFRQIPDPYSVKDTIMKLQRQKAYTKMEDFRKMMES